MVAAVIFVAAPSRIDHVMHLELLWTACMPLAVLGTVRLLRGRGRGAWLTGASLAAQFLCCIYYGVFMITLWPLVAGRRVGAHAAAAVARQLVAARPAWLVAAAVVGRRLRDTVPAGPRRGRRSPED